MLLNHFLFSSKEKIALENTQKLQLGLLSDLQWVYEKIKASLVITEAKKGKIQCVREVWEKFKI